MSCHFLSSEIRCQPDACRRNRPAAPPPHPGGAHPHHARECGEGSIPALRAIAAQREVVAIGECGLDFNRNYSPHPDQEKWFVAQLELAAELGKPLFLHSRDAHPRFAELLRHHRVKRAVDSVLTARGFSEGGTPDFMVGWHASIEGKMDVNTVNNYYGYGWGRWYGPGYPGYSSTTVREYDEGTIIIDMVDARAKELAWRGRGRGEIRPELDPAERERRITDAIAQILETFPPTKPK